jgi:uncharacterized protein
MFLPFFDALRKGGVPVSIREYLAFLEAMGANLATYDPDGFYQLARMTMVKDERHIDRFDRAFAQAFQGLDAISADAVIEALDLPADWLTKMAEKHLSAAERAEIAAGTSPFGAYGYNPEGVRIGQDQSRHQKAVKVWDRREFRNLDDSVELGTRNIKIALRRLRRWVREGAEDELDLDGTIRATAEHGYLDVQTRPERRNAVKVLLFLDSGGSMDSHVKVVEELFSAARAEFKSLTHFYFHNCLYESVWRDNHRRWDQQTPTNDLLRSYGSDYKCIFVGDATMSPYEISHPGGANEHWNAEAGAVWLARARDQWPQMLWINPVPAAQWAGTPSVGMIRAVIGQDRMVPMTLAGLSAGMKELGR